MSKNYYACIEVGANKDLIGEYGNEIEEPNSYVCNVIPIKVEYQWILSHCTKCKVLIGHDCSKPKKKFSHYHKHAPNTSHVR